MKFKVLTIIIFLIIINMIFININNVYATGISDVITGGDDFVSAGANSNSNLTINETQLQETSKIIFNVLVSVGTVIAVLVASIMGIKFMMSSAEEKAQLKESFIPFIVGCVIIFGAFGFWSIFVKVLSNL